MLVHISIYNANAPAGRWEAETGGSHKLTGIHSGKTIK